MRHLISFQILIKHQCYFQLLLQHLKLKEFFKEFMLICANINLFGFLSLISCKSLQLCIKGLSLCEHPSSSTSRQDISLFREKLQSKNFLWKLLASCHDLLKHLIFFIKLIANLTNNRIMRSFIFFKNNTLFTKNNISLATFLTWTYWMDFQRNFVFSK